MPVTTPRATPSRGKSRLFTPPGSLATVPAASRAGDAGQPPRGDVDAAENRGVVTASAAEGEYSGSARARDAVDQASRAAPGQPAAGVAKTGGSELDLLKEIEPWAMPEGEAGALRPQEAVAEALERVARLIRDGEIVLPPDSEVPSDQAAVALALAALLRSADS